MKSPDYNALLSKMVIVNQIKQKSVILI